MPERDFHLTRVLMDECGETIDGHSEHETAFDLSVGIVWLLEVETARVGTTALALQSGEPSPVGIGELAPAPLASQRAGTHPRPQSASHLIRRGMYRRGALMARMIPDTVDPDAPIRKSESFSSFATTL